MGTDLARDHFEGRGNGNNLSDTSSKSLEATRSLPGLDWEKFKSDLWREATEQLSHGSQEIANALFGGQAYHPRAAVGYGGDDHSVHLHFDGQEVSNTQEISHGLSMDGQERGGRGR